MFSCFLFLGLTEIRWPLFVVFRVVSAPASGVCPVPLLVPGVGLGVSFVQVSPLLLVWFHWTPKGSRCGTSFFWGDCVFLFFFFFSFFWGVRLRVCETNPSTPIEDEYVQLGLTSFEDLDLDEGQRRPQRVMDAWTLWGTWELLQEYPKGRPSRGKRGGLR